MKRFKVLVLVGLAVLVLGGFTSCGNPPVVGPEIVGTWDAGYGSEKIITATKYTDSYNGSVNYSATIVSYNNTEWNEDTSDALGDCGYMVIRFDSNPSWFTTSIEGKYTICRWQSLETADGTTTVSFSEGTDDTSFSDTIPSDYFGTAEAAITGATNAGGWFTYSSMTK